jgi:branched-subunit amino acid transport protein
MTVIFWVEATLGPITNSTVQGSGRWNPNILQGKFLVQIVDPTPPTIESVSLTPQQPTSSDNVTVKVNFEKNPLGAKMSQARLEYSLNGVAVGTTLNMTKSVNGAFQATIPAEAAGSEVSYSITGIDAARNSVQSDWASYVVSPSQAEQAAQRKFQVTVVGIVAAIVAVILAAVLYRQRTRVRPRIKSLTATLPSTCNAFTTSVVLSIAVVGFAAYSIMQYGHVWLGLVSLAVVVELWGLADPRLGTLFGLFGSPEPGARAAAFDAFRTPGAPLLVSAYTLVLVGTAGAVLLDVGGFIDRQGLFAIMHFFASYAIILVGLAALVRYLAYAFPANAQSARAKPT